MSDKAHKPAKIVAVMAREILDSRGNPTVEADVVVEGGWLGRASAPSGASTGRLEALELRDGDAARYGGAGVARAVAHVCDEIGPALLGIDALDQRAVDACMIALDGTPNKSRLGANAILPVSLASAKAASAVAKRPLYAHFGDGCLLPTPLINVLNGGAHAANSTDIQEFMVAPISAPDMRTAVRMGAEIFHALRSILKKRGGSTTVGDEGGFAPRLASNEAAIELVLAAVERAGYRPGEDVLLALDAASSEFYADGRYHFRSEDRVFTTDELIDCYAGWIDKYPIASIEDGLAEDDWDGWVALTRRLGDRVQLVGDDLFVTNVEIIRRGIEAGAANAALIKPNQIGTLSETLDAVRVAREANYSCVISHRSGETEDAVIADIAVATAAGQIKTGSMSRTDRVAKYNQLLRIEEALGDRARYAGAGSLPLPGGRKA